jgi:anti-anti-sigma factor
MFDHDGAARRLGQLCSMQIDRKPATVQIRLRGEFDMSCAERFEDQLDGVLEPETKALIVDLCDLQFVDTTGLRMLITLDRTTTAYGIEYTILCREEGAVRHVLKETGLDGMLPVVSPFGPVPRSDSPV